MVKLRLVAIALVMSTPALAQSYGIDTQWNTSGPKPTPCLFNGQAFYPADEVCVRPGFKQVCQPDGSLGAPVAEPDCKAAVGRRAESFSRHGAESEFLCDVDGTKFSAGAEICVAPGKKQACQANGSLGASTNESACSVATN